MYMEVFINKKGEPKETLVEGRDYRIVGDMIELHPQVALRWLSEDEPRSTTESSEPQNPTGDTSPHPKK